jgi:hypothetical protein
MVGCKCPRGHPIEEWLRLDYVGASGLPVQFGWWLHAYDYEVGHRKHVSPCDQYDEMLGFRPGAPD